MIRGNRAAYYRQHPSEQTPNMKFASYSEDAMEDYYDGKEDAEDDDDCAGLPHDSDCFWID